VLILIISVAFILALIFIPILRRIIGVLLTIGISLLAIGSAVFGFAVLMNNVSINERPGMHARIRRFLTVNWAATSDKGLGAVTCEQTEKSGGEVVEAAAEKTTEPKGRRKEAKLAATPTPTPSATATPEAGAEEEGSKLSGQASARPKRKKEGKPENVQIRKRDAGRIRLGLRRNRLWCRAGWPRSDPPDSGDELRRRR